ncbi:MULTISPECIES: hypothetical protein [Enterobacter]|uniref:hypothetical protein n=1 Tax=Enterobacter TaxID=547 RepID=UPI001CC15940|nr:MULTISPECIES: hypothetical protein [Enterobacter]UAN18638.1 hypothetical protein KGP20_23630 [Enterobacter asburiae]UAN24857.1 hypothetical protein KGP25_25870 [Enterobacter sp. JBIWA003]
MDSSIIFSFGVAIVIVVGAITNVLYAYKRTNSFFLIVFGGIITAISAFVLLSYLGITNDWIVSISGVLAAFLYTICVLMLNGTINNIFSDLKISRDIDAALQKPISRNKAA